MKFPRPGTVVLTLLMSYVTARVNGGLILTINERINAFFSEVSNRLKFPALFFYLTTVSLKPNSEMIQDSNLRKFIVPMRPQIMKLTWMCDSVLPWGRNIF